MLRRVITSKHEIPLFHEYLLHSKFRVTEFQLQFFISGQIWNFPCYMSALKMFQMLVQFGIWIFFIRVPELVVRIGKLKLLYSKNMALAQLLPAYHLLFTVFLVVYMAFLPPDSFVRYSHARTPIFLKGKLADQLW